MSTWLIVVITVLYALTALDKVWRAEYTWAMVWFGYAFANVGLILMEVKQ